MAQEQHLKMIHEAIERHDVSIWNNWRQEHPDIRPDLSGTDLRRADLKNAALQGVIFRDANLRGTDLSNSDLSGADLNRANLVRAHFSAANLAEANFSGANLTEANLTEAILSEAHFGEALLLGALFLGADLNRAHLEDDVRELTPSQIKAAKHWESAYYSKHILEDLGLDPDHNEKLRREMGEKTAQS